MKFLDYLVVTKDGQVGDLIYKSTIDDKKVFIANIPNGLTAQTLFTEDEVDIVWKKKLPKNTKF